MSTLARAAPDWLGLREGADAAARSRELVDLLRPHLPTRALVVHDLGGGTGSMGRWLAPLLAGPQRWVVHDRDAGLLALAGARERHPRSAADGAPVTLEAREGDITRLAPAELAGASLLTASALLDMLTAAELGRLSRSCLRARCPVLITLSVLGRVELSPADPLDAEVGDAFNDHQRRAVNGRSLLGPDAVEVAADELAADGAEVVVRPSPWLLGPADAALVGAWLNGRVAAAVEARPALGPVAGSYHARRLAQVRSGALAVTVQHADLLAVPR